MMKIHRLIARALILALIVIWLTGSQPAQGSDLIHTAPPTVSGRIPALAATPLGSAFTYQGQLKDGSGNPITNTCDFQFNLYDAASGGSLVGNSPQNVTGVAVANGYFTVSLDFGASAFDGNKRWLQIGVSCPAGGSYTPLTTLQPVTAAPNALYAVTAGAAVNADQLDGLHAAAFQQHPQNVRVVAKSGGDYTTITAALNSISDASATNQYLVYVAPGVYNETVNMKSWVDIQGSGELATMITWTGNSGGKTGTVVGADNAELRFLTVENTGGNTYAIAIYNSGASPRLTHITANASGGTYNYGVYNYNSSSPSMTNVTTSVSVGTLNYSVYNVSSSSPSMTNVTASASGAGTNVGVRNLSSSPSMTNITASASGGTDNSGIQNNSSSPTMANVTATVTGSLSSMNFGVYNTSSSPVMTNVSATVNGGTYSIGVYNASSSSPSMMSVTANASAGTNNYGMWNVSSSPTITDANLRATGGSNNYGVWNESSSVTIQNSIISASGGTNDGIHNYATSSTYTVTIDACQITGGTSTVYQTAQFTTRIGASRLAGNGGQGAGTYKCVASYNQNYDPLNATTCQYP